MRELCQREIDNRFRRFISLWREIHDSGENRFRIRFRYGDGVFDTTIENVIVRDLIAQ